LATATRTIVFTDLANYTAKVSRMDREGLRRILVEHEGLVTPIVQRFRGRVVKNLGDSYMCIFSSATDALRAALDIQDVVTREGTIAIRVGMATGDVEEIDGDAFGEPANLAARILSQTPGSEIWFGSGTFACMNAAEIPWEPVGRFRLKGLPGEQEVYRAVPQHRSWLPESVVAAVKRGALVRLRRGVRAPLLPPDPVILLEGFAPGSAALDDAVGALPVLNPASLWLAAYNIAPIDRGTWLEHGRGLVIGTPEGIEEALQEAAKVVSRPAGSDTIVLDGGARAELELVMAGMAFPSVPLSEVVASYFYDLLPDGRWVNRSDRAALRVEVTEAGARLVATAPGVMVNGRTLGSGEGIRLEPGSDIRTPSGAYTFLPGGSGYEGLFVADTDLRFGVAQGQTVELGREPNHPGLAYPDRQGQDNIRWCTGARAARAQAQRFSLDRALAGRRQCAVRFDEDLVEVTQIHDRCPTYILRQGARALEQVEHPVRIEPDDLIVAGTTVVALRAPPLDD
jgi:class 3 adenylate cyclase